MREQVQDLLKQHGLAQVLGELTRAYGSEVLCLEMDEHSPEQLRQAKAMAQTLNACWQYAKHYAPSLSKGE